MEHDEEKQIFCTALNDIRVKHKLELLFLSLFFPAE